MGRVFGALESVLTAGMALGALLMPLLIATVGLAPWSGVIGGVGGSARAGRAAGAAPDRHHRARPAGPELLRGVPMLALLPPPTLERLAHVLVTMTVPAGESVIDEGDVGDRFWIIEQGSAIVGIAARTSARSAPGDTFGEIALLRDVPRTAAVRAGDDGAVLKGLERDDFLPAVTGHGEALQAAESVVDRWLALG